MATVAEFLSEKMCNMAKWLSVAGCPQEPIPPVGDLELVAFAHILHNDYSEAIRARDFVELQRDKENLPPSLTSVVHFVESHPELHDKFWRYLELFSEVVSSA